MTDVPRAHRRVDARGALCPVPTVKAALALEHMAPGEILELLVDDPVTRRDLPAWCRETGHQVQAIQEKGADFFIYIRKG